jgi:hypothetical protein
LRVHHQEDDEGPFYQFGPNGNKHRYVDGDSASETEARIKAQQDEKDYRASGYGVKPGITSYEQPPEPAG